MVRIAIAALCLTAACSQARLNELDACIDRGRDYFASVGAATLDTGKTARETAEERCMRSTSAF